MESNGLFSKTVSILQDSLDLRSKKHNLLTSNVANMDTPNFKGFDLVIGEAMQGSEKMKPVAARPNHIQLNHNQKRHLDYKIIDMPQTIRKGDGNTVDIDKVMSSLAENTIMYKASIQIISKKLQGLKNAIKGGK